MDVIAKAGDRARPAARSARTAAGTALRSTAVANRTLFTGATFHTMESPEDTHISMTVEDGVIVAFDEVIGPLDSARKDAFASADSSFSQPHANPSETRVVDLGGVHVFPALIDTHMHLLDAIGISALGFPLCEVRDNRIEPHNLAGVRQIIADKAARAPKDKILVVGNYIAQAMDEGRLPTRFELDEWTNGMRVWVLNMDGHSCACSTALLDELELADVAPDGILRGAANDANLGRMTAALTDSLSLQALAAGIARFVNDCASWGIGCICALEGSDDVERDTLMDALCIAAPRLPLDVRLYPQYTDTAKLLRAQRYMGKPRVGGCMKWELDGSVGSSTAAFRTPFLNGMQGHLYFDSIELQALVEVFAAEGMQVSAHAIGECAIDQLLDAYERLPEQRDEFGNFPHRIDHCEFPSQQAVERLKKLKPYVTVQPGYAWFDKRFLHGYERVLPPEIIAQQVPLRTLVEAGVALLGSSDAPVQEPDPYAQMRGMREFYVEEESLNAFQALQTYTVFAGQSLGEKRGKLAIGYKADFMLHDCDLLQIAPDDLSGLRARGLYLDGRLFRPLPEDIRMMAQLLRTSAKKL